MGQKIQSAMGFSQIWGIRWNAGTGIPHSDAAAIDLDPLDFRRDAIFGGSHWSTTWDLISGVLCTPGLQPHPRKVVGVGARAGRGF